MIFRLINEIFKYKKKNRSWSGDIFIVSRYVDVRMFVQKLLAIFLLYFLYHRQEFFMSTPLQLLPYTL